MPSRSASDSGGTPLSAVRFTLGPVQNPVRATLHGLAALVYAAIGAQALTGGAGGPAGAHAAIGAGEGRVALGLLGASHAGLFAVSALYHAVPWSPCWKRRVQRLDHSMIYLKIAGTITALAWLGTRGETQTLLIGAVWGIAAAGVLQKLAVPGFPERASIPVQILQATLAVPAAGALAGRAAEAPPWLAASALCYGAGAVVFLTEWPRLWPRIFSFHELFHLLVVGGSAATTAAVLGVLAAG